MIRGLYWTPAHPVATTDGPPTKSCLLSAPPLLLSFGGEKCTLRLRRQFGIARYDSCHALVLGGNQRTSKINVLLIVNLTILSTEGLITWLESSCTSAGSRRRCTCKLYLSCCWTDAAGCCVQPRERGRGLEAKRSFSCIIHCRNSKNATWFNYRCMYFYNKLKPQCAFHTLLSDSPCSECTLQCTVRRAFSCCCWGLV